MRVGKIACLVASVLSLLFCSGCNAGLAAILVVLLLDDDGDNNYAPPPEPLSSVTFHSVHRARTAPDDARILFVLKNEKSRPTDLRIDASVDGADFPPATLIEPLPAEMPEPGLLAGLETTPTGVVYAVGWNSVADFGDDAYREVTLRFRIENVDPVLADVATGNDPPVIVDAVLTPQEDGQVLVDVVLSDSSSDPVDLLFEIEQPPAGDGDPEFVPGTTTGPTTDLQTTLDGVAHSFQWDALADLGTVDRTVTVRITPADRINGQEGKEGEPVLRDVVLDGNQPPEVAILQEELLTSPDARGGILVSFQVRDAESDPVDVILQRAGVGEGFPELDPALDEDAAARESLLASAAEREALAVLTPATDFLRGIVEEPAAGTQLAASQVKASWLKSSASLRGLEGNRLLAGRRVELVSAGGDVLEDSIVCSYDPAAGVLEVDPPFEPAAQPGSRIRIALGGETATVRLASSPDGVTHRMIWNAAADAPGGGFFRIRATPYDRVRSGTDGPCADAEPEPGARAGDRGGQDEMTGSKQILGPFGGADPQVLDLYPVDRPAALAAADVDGDGRTDLVCASRFPGDVVVFLQTVSGKYDMLRLADRRVADVSDVVAGDLDGDGDTDLAVTGSGSGNILLVLQEPGLDLFSHRILLTAGGALQHPENIVAADIDGDGNVDLAATDPGNAEGALTVFFRSGAPPSAACGLSEEGYGVCFVKDPGGGERLADLAAAQVFGGAGSDLVAAGGTVVKVYSMDSGSFQIRRVDLPLGVLTCATAADADGDGKTDLAACDARDSALVIWLQDAGGEFAEPVRVRSTFLRGPVAVTAADLDGNSMVDFAVAGAGDPPGRFGGGLHAFLGDAAGRYSSTEFEREVPLEAAPPTPVDVLAVDLDGDGRLELVSADDGSLDLAVFELQGPGDFSSPAVSVTGGQGTGEPSFLAGSDLDGDGDMDFLGTVPLDDGVTWFRQTAGGGFAALQLALPPAARGPAALAAGDVDGDGRADIVTANLDSGDLSVLFQDDAGSFGGRSLAVTSEGLAGPISVALSDITGDGRLDVAVAGFFSHDVRWIPQEEGGGFGEAVVLPPDGGTSLLMTGPVAVIASDLDRDGRPDIAAAHQLSQRIVAYFQDAARGSFPVSSGTQLPAGMVPVCLVTGDVDGDGRGDLAAAGRGSAAAAVLLQSSPRAFVLSTLPAQGDDDPTGLAIRDCDRDGRPDLVVAFSSAWGARIRVYYQKPGGGFDAGRSRELESPDLFTPVGVVALDADGDGETDLASAGRRSRSLTLFFGGR